MFKRREGGGAQRQRLRGKSSCSFFRPRPPHGYLGYPWSGAGEREGWVSVLAPPSGGRPRTLILHHSPHRLLPSDLLTPTSRVMTSGVHADLGRGTQRVVVKVCASVGAWPQGVSIGHSLAAHSSHIDLGDGHAPQCGVTIYTHLLGL